MNTKVVIVVVIALLLLGGGAVVVLKKPASTSSQNTTVTQEPTNSPKSLRDLFAANVSQTCTFSDSASNTSTTVYVSGGKMRGDFSGGHMISMDNSIYYWMDGQTTGYKMSMVVPTGTVSTGSPTNPNTQVDLDKQADYKCSIWVADQTKFDLPPDVKFSDPTSMMQNAMQGVTGMPKIDCSTCDSVPAGTARDQCLVALKCK